MHWKEIYLDPIKKQFFFQGQKLFIQYEILDALKFHSPGLAGIKLKQGWCFIDKNGKKNNSHYYLNAFGFYDDLATVENEKGAFHINPDGTRLYPDNYFKWCGNFQEGKCVVQDFSETFFHIDKNGNRCYEASFSYVGDFKYGFACVMNEEQNFTHIDYKGKFLHGEWFQDLGIYHKGFATAKDEIGWFHIDFKGNALYDFRFKTLEPFYNKWAFAETLDGEKVRVNEVGEVRSF